MSSASEREELVQETVIRVRLQPCTCPLRHCPFNNVCELCVKNHRLDGTLTHCMLPPIPERDDCGECRNLRCEWYPDCRSPVLWLLYFARHPEKTEEWIERLGNPRLREALRIVLDALRPVSQHPMVAVPVAEGRSYAGVAREWLQRARRPA